MANVHRHVMAMSCLCCLFEHGVPTATEHPSPGCVASYGNEMVDKDFRGLYTVRLAVSREASSLRYLWAAVHMNV